MSARPPCETIRSRACVGGSTPPAGPLLFAPADREGTTGTNEARNNTTWNAAERKKRNVMKPIGWSIKTQENQREWDLESEKWSDEWSLTWNAWRTKHI